MNPKLIQLLAKAGKWLYKNMWWVIPAIETTFEKGIKPLYIKIKNKIKTKEDGREDQTCSGKD